MRTLITGGAGFIGSHLCDALHRRGDDVWCVDNMLLGRRENVNHLMDSPRFHFREMDVLDRKALDTLFDEARYDAVFHLAANSDIQKGGLDHSVDFRNTFLSTYEIVEAMARHQVQSIFFASTSAVFGETSDRLHETYGPLQPISFYGAGKLASEAYLSVFSNNYNIQTTVLRFPNIVGPRASHGVLYDFIVSLKKDPSCLKILGDGKQKKPYLHVSDLIRAILLVSGQSNNRYEVYHASGSDELTVSELAAIVLKEMNLKDCRIAYTGGDRGWVGDVPRFCYDNSKLQALGWAPTFTSGEAVRTSTRQILEAAGR